jgi:hypothetical protein
MTKWTAGQIKKLDTLISKLEALQSEVSDPSGDLARAKAALFDADRKARS